MIEENVKNLIREIPATNPFGEKVTLVAAVKFQSTENINRAIAAGITDIGDNHVQEFRDKYSEIQGNPKRHFIGRLQTNKVKYLVGKTDLYHSVDRLKLAEEISKRSESLSRVLLEVNVSGEESKGGFGLDEAEKAYLEISKLPNIKVVGLMTMLPDTDDESLLRALATKTRAFLDKIREKDPDFATLSMGMSGDWRICVECGSNMIRLGTAIFGARNYNK